MEIFEFKSLPDETTPLNPPNLKKIQENAKKVFDGQESMGSIVVENIECKNLFDINTKNATSNATAEITSNQIVLSCSGAWAQTRFKKIKVKQGETYTLSFTVENPSANTVAIVIYKSDNSTKIANTQNYINTSFSEHLTFTANDTEIVIALVANNSSTTNTNSVTFSNIQLEKGNIATQFAEHKDFINPLIEDLTSKFIINSENAKISSTYQSRILKIGNIVYLKLCLTLINGITANIDTVNLGKVVDPLIPKVGIVNKCLIGTTTYAGWTFDVADGQVNISSVGEITVRNIASTSAQKKYIVIDVMYLV